MHSTPDGRANQPLPDNVRVSVLGHAALTRPIPPRKSAAQQQADNPVQCAWTMRALLVAMTQWVSNGTMPPQPASAVQRGRCDDRQGLGHSVPGHPGVQSPRIVIPGRDRSRTLPLLVSQVDADGNERAGIRLPEVSVPLATYRLEFPKP